MRLVALAVTVLMILSAPAGAEDGSNLPASPVSAGTTSAVAGTEATTAASSVGQAVPEPADAGVGPGLSDADATAAAAWIMPAAQRQALDAVVARAVVSGLPDAAGGQIYLGDVQIPIGSDRFQHSFSDPGPHLHLAAGGWLLGLTAFASLQPDAAASATTLTVVTPDQFLAKVESPGQVNAMGGNGLVEWFRQNFAARFGPADRIALRAAEPWLPLLQQLPGGDASLLTATLLRLRVPQAERLAVLQAAIMGPNLLRVRPDHLHLTIDEIVDERRRDQRDVAGPANLSLPDPATVLRLALVYHFRVQLLYPPNPRQPTTLSASDAATVCLGLLDPGETDRRADILGLVERAKLPVHAPRGADLATRLASWDGGPRRQINDEGEADDQPLAGSDPGDMPGTQDGDAPGAEQPPADAAQAANGEPINPQSAGGEATGAGTVAQAAGEATPADASAESPGEATTDAPAADAPAADDQPAVSERGRADDQRPPFTADDADALVALCGNPQPCRWLDQGRPRTLGDNALRALAVLMSCDPRVVVGREPLAVWDANERAATATAIQAWWRTNKGHPLTAAVANLIGSMSLDQIATTLAASLPANRGVLLDRLAQTWHDHAPVDPDPDQLIPILDVIGDHPALVAEITTWPVAGRQRLVLAVWHVRHGDDRPFDALCAEILRPSPAAGAVDGSASVAALAPQDSASAAALADSASAAAPTDSASAAEVAAPEQADQNGLSSVADPGTLLSVIGRVPTPARLRLLQRLIASDPGTPAWEMVAQNLQMFGYGGGGGGILTLLPAPAHPEQGNPTSSVVGLTLVAGMLADRRPLPQDMQDQLRQSAQMMAQANAAGSPGQSASAAAPAPAPLRVCDYALSVVSNLVMSLAQSNDQALMQRLSQLMQTSFDPAAGDEAHDQQADQVLDQLRPLLQSRLRSLGLPARVGGTTSLPGAGDAQALF